MRSLPFPENTMLLSGCLRGSVWLACPGHYPTHPAEPYLPWRGIHGFFERLHVFSGAFHNLWRGIARLQPSFNAFEPFIEVLSSSGVTVHLQVAPAHGMSGRGLIFGFLLKLPVVPPAEWREFRCRSSIRIRSLQLSMNDGEAPGFSIHFLTCSIHSSMMFFSGVIVPLDGGCSSLNAARTGSHEGLNLLQSGKCFQ